MYQLTSVSEDWRALRVGVTTASKAPALLGFCGIKEFDNAWFAIKNKIDESVLNPKRAKLPNFIRGKHEETNAIQQFCSDSKSVVIQCGYFKHPSDERFGASPGGISIGQDSFLVEIKTRSLPNKKTTGEVKPRGKTSENGSYANPITSRFAVKYLILVADLFEPKCLLSINSSPRYKLVDSGQLLNIKCHFLQENGTIPPMLWKDRRISVAFLTSALPAFNKYWSLVEQEDVITALISANSGTNFQLSIPFIDDINGPYSETEAVRRALELSAKENSKALGNFRCDDTNMPQPMIPRSSCNNPHPDLVILSDGMESDDSVDELNKTFQGLSSPSKDDRTSDSSLPCAIQDRKRQLYRESSESDSGSNSTSESLDSSPERYFFGRVLLVTYHHVINMCLAFFHGRTEPLTNEEVLEVMASQESRHLYSSIQVKTSFFLISTENMSPSDAAVDAMGVWKQMVRRRTYRNKAWKDLVKGRLLNQKNSSFHTYLFSTDSRESPVHLIYCHTVTVKQANRRTSRVNPSTMQLLKEETDCVTSARKAYHNVEKKVGGLTGASAVS
ncbi:hypothetical protein OS493_039131 [Desmophyllum pertusum]|uniref:YqaJ viral recombinase domain-containing protein n=1 Tax=Desmophyllum pertusum TaxID=174260 RepID=A0A9W9YH98_9CNID|nr:hypothetical protein OS493_039131 [Desmophyllum pertusum]